jgi:hypothetical protein
VAQREGLPRLGVRDVQRHGNRSILGRIVLALIGLGIAALGWTMMMTVFLVFIGLPLFILGLAIAQAQES